MEQLKLIELEELPKGFVSAYCEIKDDDAGQRHVLLDGNIAYTYDLSDASMERFVWVNVYKQHYATYKQISDATDIGLRTIKDWVKKEREHGADALITKPPKGRKPLSENKKKKIISLREERLPQREIARLCGVGNGTVCKVLQEACQESEEQLHLLDQEKKLQPTSPMVQVDANELYQPVSPKLYDDKEEEALAQDRTADRGFARLGVIQDAEPLFAPCENLQFAGMFIVFASLAADPFLKLGTEIFSPFKAAFYGVRTTLLTLLTMSLLRLKRPEYLRQDDPVKLGRILGLDRVQEVKTLRRKIHQLSSAEHTEEFMRKMAYERSREYCGDTKTVMVDGHVAAYFGKHKVGSTWSARDNRVVKGQTENWVNLSGKCPLFSLETPFNEGLSKSLEQVLAQTKEILKTDELTCVFDRGGYCVELFEKLTEENYGLITYRKGNYDKIDENLFQKIPTIVGGREYDYAPFEQDIDLKVYKTVDNGPNKKPGRHDTKRTLRMREIRILRSDGGQTSILVNKHVKSDCLEVAATLFSRVGSQENIFKYMRSEFDLDALTSYDFDTVSSTIVHPNPDFNKREKEAADLRKKRKKLLAELGDEIHNCNPEQVLETLRKFGHTDKAVKLEELEEQLLKIHADKSETPVRENAAEAGYKTPNTATKRLMNVIKMSAYMIETKLFEQLEPYYKNTNKEGRKLLAAAFKTNGTLKLAPGELIITLDPQSSPSRTIAINRLTQEINQAKAKFPGSQRVIRFEATAVNEK